MPDKADEAVLRVTDRSGRSNGGAMNEPSVIFSARVIKTAYSSPHIVTYPQGGGNVPKRTNGRARALV